MSYGDTGVVFAWTNPEIRRPHRWYITPYFANSAMTDDIYVAFTEEDMQTKFGKMQELAKATLCYDQIVVTKGIEVVPSVGDTGTYGDVIP